MDDKIRSIIGKNVKAIRKSIGLSLLDFSIVISISKASVVKIESGKAGYNVNLLDNIISFSRCTLAELSNKDFIPSDNLRDKLIKLYKKHPQFYSILSQKPEISYAIKFKLLRSDFLDIPREINEIKNFFEIIGWSFMGTSISNSLKRLPDLIEIRQQTEKKNTFVYSRKK